MNLSKLFSLIFTSFFFINLAILTGCTNQDENEITQTSKSEPAPITGGTYRTPLWNDPATLDPAFVQDEYGVSVVKQIFDGLVKFNSYLSVLPALAETWQVKDKGKVYIFTLKESATFHNREPVTSGDVAFSIKRILRAEPAPAVLPHLLKIVGAKKYRDRTLENVPGIKIKSDTVLQVTLKESHVPFLTALGMYQAAIVPQKEVIRLGDEFGKHPIGSGAFRFVSWEEGKSIQLKQFKGYYAGPAYLDGIHYKIYQKGQDPLVLADFQNGNIEETAVYGDIKKKLADSNGLQWFHRPSLSLFFYGMNLNHPHLVNPELRKALSIAIDRTSFVNQVYNGRFEIAKTILPPGMPGYNPLNQMDDNNPDLARKHIERIPAKSMEDLPELEIVSAFKTPRVEKEMAMIKGFWADLGIKLKVKYIIGWTKFEDYLKSNSVQIYRYAWFADMPDPDSFLYSLFSSESPTNFMGFEDEEVDRKLLTARGIVDPVERAAMYQKIEASIMVSAPLIPLFYMSVDRVYQPYVKSVNVSALGAHTMPLNEIWLDKSTQND